MSFHGKRVGILEFMKYKDQLTGSLTNAHEAIGADGIVSMYQIPGSAPVVETAIRKALSTLLSRNHRTRRWASR